MIGADTNILVRYLIQDDVIQSEQASRWIESVQHKKEFIFINQVVFCELVWVLQGPYEIDKKVLLVTLEKILLAKQFEFESKDEIW
ncbi:MAG: PIN domain-containing protein, partial [Myxococcaceae bacterium]